MSETWYVAKKYYDTISPVTVDKVTDKYLWIGGRRVAKNGFDKHFRSWDEAHNYIVSDLRDTINRLAQNVAATTRKLEVALAMKAPT